MQGRLAQLGASLTANQRVTGLSPGPATFFLLRFGHEKLSTPILKLPLILEGQLSVTGERMGTKYWTNKLPRRLAQEHCG